MISVCIIGIWIGPFLPWMDLWIKSVCYNPTIDFLVITDQNTPSDIPENLHFINSTLPDIKKKAESKLGMSICLKAPYKLCDYKCVFGKILEEELKGYDYWGHCDFDMIFGDIRTFIEKYAIWQYDKFFNRGHLTLYRNNKEVMDRYRLSGGVFGTYKEIFRSDLVWGFDEMYGINRIYQKHGFPCFNEFIFADIARQYWDMRLVSASLKSNGNANYPLQVFCWKNGKIFQEWIEEDSGMVCAKEFAYIHFAKRKFEKPSDAIILSDQFCITPGGFLEMPESMSVEWIEQHNLRDSHNVVIRKDRTSKFDKKMKFLWIGRKYLNLKYWIMQRK